MLSGSSLRKERGVTHPAPKGHWSGLTSKSSPLASEREKRLQLLAVAVTVLAIYPRRAVAAGRILCSAVGILLAYTFLQLDSEKSRRLRLRPIIQVCVTILCTNVSKSWPFYRSRRA